MNNIVDHPTSHNATKDRMQDRENLARQLRTTQMMREMAREQINPTEIITELINIGIKLEGDHDKAGNPIPLEKEITTQLRARADIKFRLLSKVLPDLKATESISYSAHDHMHQHEHKHVSNMELAQRLQLWRRDHLPAISAPGGGSDEEIVYDFL